MKRMIMEITYTKEQIDELKSCIDPITGPEYFLRNFIFVQHPVHGNVKITPYDYQISALNEWHMSKNNAVLHARQLGFTTLSAAYLLWNAMFINDKSSMYVGYKYDDSDSMFAHINLMWQMLPMYLRANMVSFNKLKISFDNGSTISCQRNDIKDANPSLIIMGNAAFTGDTTLLTALKYAIDSSETKCVILSGANYDDDKFAILFNHADAYGFKSSTYTYRVHPDRCDPLWEDDVRRMIGNASFDYHHNCKFKKSLL